MLFARAYRSIHPSIHQSINPSIHQSVNPAIRQSIHPSINPSINQPSGGRAGHQPIISSKGSVSRGGPTHQGTDIPPSSSSPWIPMDSHGIPIASSGFTLSPIASLDSFGLPGERRVIFIFRWRVRGNAVGAAGVRYPIVGDPLGRTENSKKLNHFE